MAHPDSDRRNSGLVCFTFLTSGATNHDHDHDHDYYKLLDEEKGRVVYSSDVTYHHPEVPWITPSSMRIALTEPC